ncbi:hypothetical protein niasHT_020356 [Heterodera trifolii]|uniref:Uncharacterized protein n=1 Tax=Heterodera trifolii TaxID=157864 RepID=A0ABD2JX37_9BILA
MDKFNERPSTLMRLSRSFFRFPAYLRERVKDTAASSRSCPGSQFASPHLEASSPSSIVPSMSFSTIGSSTSSAAIAPMIDEKGELLNRHEVQLISKTLNCALKELDFGNEIVVRLLNDKRSLFKSLLARCAKQAHDIEVFDPKSLARFCPRAVRVGDGVTRFFENLAIELEKGHAIADLEQKVAELCRANGQLHYRMKVWFQAENWLCVKRSVVDTVIVAHTKQFDTFCGGVKRSMHSVELVWMKFMQAVIMWMKQGFLEAALSQKEEHQEDEQL